MKTRLQQYFPLIRTREEIEREILSNPVLQDMFFNWKKKGQEEFLDFMSGAKGVKMLYDSFFKEILNPESTPGRLEEFLSLVLKKKVRILKVLPNDGVRLADEASLLITDIVVELEDKSIANVEMQKIGYKFPGQRSACYSADLLLRQYKRVKDEKEDTFSYQDIKPVYTIILFERSTKEFHAYPETYIHSFKQQSDTGIPSELLQEYTYIPLDIFRKYVQNKGIRNKLEAWLAFLSFDEIEMILTIITQYPEFKELYSQLYEICRNMEQVMGMFSKELQILDRNTVQYMIDEMQETIDRQKEELEEKERLYQNKLNEKERLHQEEMERKEKEYRKLLDEIKRLKEKNERMKKSL